MKSEKELAFLHDLYVAPDWGERFAELVDAHIKLPKEGRALSYELVPAISKTRDTQASAPLAL